MISSLSNHIDARVPYIVEKSKHLRAVVVVVGPKGGVGKTTIATALALLLSKRGCSVGLLDLDVTNPNMHILLGVDVAGVKLSEERGLIPPVFHGVEFMSIAFFTRGEAAPMRGEAVLNAIREILAVTVWKSNILVVDTAPGISDEVLEPLHLFKDRSCALIVTTCSKLSMESARRVLRMLMNERSRVCGIVANMCEQSQSRFALLAEIGGQLPTVFIPVIPELEDLMGRPVQIASRLEPYLNTLIGELSPGWCT